jgi:hypothetical protein
MRKLMGLRSESGEKGMWDVEVSYLEKERERNDANATSESLDSRMKYR